MKRIALVSSEPIRPRMGGIGIRYAGFARHLSAQGFAVVLVCPTPEVADLDLPLEAVHPFKQARLASHLAGCDAVVTQGQRANAVLQAVPEVPTVIDLYDPWLVENLHYAEALGYGPYHNDHASWVLQMGQGDFFLCASEVQRTYYLGFLTALGRVHPDRLDGDPDLRGLIDVVPFAVPDELPAHRPLLPETTDRRILFGGVYDWYDPWTLLDAVARLPFSDWQLLFMRNPNPATTPQDLARAVEEKCRRAEPWKSRVRFLDWVPGDRRFDLLREVDVLAAPHRPGLETALSMRTRYLDALAAGCPLIMTEGDALSRLVDQKGAGWTVPPEDPEALAHALTEVLTDTEQVAQRSARAQLLAAQFQAANALAPLVRFCRAPKMDETKRRFPMTPHLQGPVSTVVQHLRRLQVRLKQAQK